MSKFRAMAGMSWRFGFWRDMFSTIDAVGLISFPRLRSQSYTRSVVFHILLVRLIRVMDRFFENIK
jgi:hypothetical protein